MNYRFVKRPVVVEAFQMTQARRWDNRDWPEWLNRAWNLTAMEDGSVFAADEPDSRLYVTAAEGFMLVDWNDWIIRGVEGELYPCDPRIFNQTYDEVVE